MATPSKPTKVQVVKRRRLWLVDTIANAAAPTDDEINAGDYLGCYPLQDQAGPTSTPNLVSLPALMCEADVEQDFGNVTHEHPPIRFAWDPQAAAASAGKKAWDLVKNGYTGNIVWEFGELADADDQVTATDFVTVVPCKIMVTDEEPTSTGEDGIMAFGTQVVVRAPYIKRNVAVVAAP